MSTEVGRWVLVGAAAAAVGTLLYNLFGADDRGKKKGGAARDADEQSVDEADASKAVSAAARGVRASASGKVLVTGGYLILERANTGLVLSVGAKFWASIVPLQQPKPHPRVALPVSIPTGAVPIVVYTPQLVEQANIYALERNTFALTRLRGNQNPFVEHTLHYGLMLLSSLVAPAQFDERLRDGLFLYLRGDSQFYTSDPVQPGVSLNKRLNGKTGLGSSAALTSSLVGALFGYFGLLPTDQSSSSSGSTAIAGAKSFSAAPIERKRMLMYAHNLAQFCHCAAQGKVGSGFDVSSAFFGSQTYRRFSPAVINPLIKIVEAVEKGGQDLDAKVLNPALAPNATLSLTGSTTSSAAASSSAAPSWDYDVSPFELPPGMILLLGDIKGGAKTPEMVKQVLAWRAKQKAKEEAAAAAKAGSAGSAAAAAAAPVSLDAKAATNEATVWTTLSAANDAVAAVFSELAGTARASPDQYAAALSNCESLTAAQWAHSLQAGEVGDRLARVRALFDGTIRVALRAMGDFSGPPIEPLPSGRLLDDTLTEPGVICAGVPGAGGNDAIFAIVCGPDAAARVEKRWAAWTAARAGKAKSAADAKDAKANDSDSDKDIEEVRVLPTSAAENGGGVGVSALTVSALANASDAKPLDLDSAFVPAILPSL